MGRCSEEIRRTAELGIQAEKTALGGAGYQMDSVWHTIIDAELRSGVVLKIWCNGATSELVKKYFMTCIQLTIINLLLHASVWSGGTFIYIQKS